MTESPSRAAAPTLSYVVPTIGVSGHLEECLASIYRDGERLDGPSELVVVWQAPIGGDAEDSAALGDLCRRLGAARPGAIDGPARIVELPRPVGFARAVNDGIAVSTGDWVALVNDDVVLEAGWARRLLEAAGAVSRVAAAQGINVMACGGDGEDARIDGAGLAWNRRWQAVQLGHGQATHWVRRRPRRPSEERARREPRSFSGCDEVYGVSATAAIYRRDALVDVSGGGDPLRPFEERLDSYYEDVELADRLRGAGYRALLVPAARAEHAGALSSRSPQAARRRTRRVYANRLLVLARRLGRGFWPRLPVLLGRDVVDALRRPKTAPTPGDLEPPGVVDLACAWGRAVRLLPRFVHFGRRAEERSEADASRALRKAGGDAGAPSADRRPGYRLGAPASPPAAAEGGQEHAPAEGRHRSTRLGAPASPPAAAEGGQEHAPAEGRHRGTRLGAPASPPAAAEGGQEHAPAEGRHRGTRLGAPASPPAAAEGGQKHAPAEGRHRSTTVLTAVAPHWHDEEHLAVLVQDWPGDPRFELIVVDNGSDGDLSELAAGRTNVRVLRPGRNLGFGAAVNRGAAEAGGDLILLLNTDAVPKPGALDALVEGMANHPDAAGLAPRLLGADDAVQAAWQLRRLPTLRTLAGYCCFLEPAPLPEPAAGAPVEQPAACALLLRRAAFESAGAMDERFWPAWFEDVDLARRLADRGERVLYWPEAVFRHGLGASVPRLGYGAFLAAYYRNLDRYARKHHGGGGAVLLRGVLVGAALVRIVLLPLRCPRRARHRGEALAGLWRVAVAAVSGWRGR